MYIEYFIKLSVKYFVLSLLSFHLSSISLSSSSLTISLTFLANALCAFYSPIICSYDSLFTSHILHVNQQNDIVTSILIYWMSLNIILYRHSAIWVSSRSPLLSKHPSLISFSDLNFTSTHFTDLLLSTYIVPVILRIYYSPLTSFPLPFLRYLYDFFHLYCEQNMLLKFDHLFPKHPVLYIIDIIN